MHCVFWMSKMRVLVNVSVNCVLNWVIGIIFGMYYVHMI